MSTLSRTATDKLAADKLAADKLAAEIQAAAPVPEWDSVPELKKWREEITVKGEKKKLTFDQMVTKYKDLSAEIDFRDKIRKEIKTHIEAGLLYADVPKVLCEGYRVQIVEKEGSKKIEANRLLELGVTADTIAKATVQGKSSSYIDIRTVKEERY